MKNTFEFVWEMDNDLWNEFADAVDRGGMFDNNETLGCCRVGDLCFDICTWGDDGLSLGFTLFCGGVDGYGYSAAEAMESGEYNDKYDVPDALLYPYDEVEYDEFDPELRTVDIDYFKEAAEPIFTKFIVDNNASYNKANLLEKANKPLHVW